MCNTKRSIVTFSPSSDPGGKAKLILSHVSQLG
jgi:hypothetical protein